MWIGFTIACVGFVALNYANFRTRKGLGLGVAQRISHAEAKQLAHGQRPPRWSVYTASICIPLGILIAFGAIVYNNHIRIR